MRAHRIRRYGAHAMRSFVLFTTLLAAGCQCGHPGPGGTGGGGGGSGDAPMSITVTPADATYTTDGISPVMAPYMATAKYADGHSEDITTKATFSLDDIGLGQFMGNIFKSVTNRGGKGNVSAILDGVTGKTTLTLVYQ